MSERIHVLLDVAGEQQSLRADADVEHERRVVDLAVRSPARSRARDRPGGQTTSARARPIAKRSPCCESDDRHAVALGLLAEGAVAAALAAHPVLGEDPDAVAGQQPGETADMVLVRVGQQRDVDAPVPDGDALVEAPDEEVGVATAVDEDPHPVVRLDEDRVALADVEHGDVERADWSGRRERSSRRRGSRSTQAATATPRRPRGWAASPCGASRHARGRARSGARSRRSRTRRSAATRPTSARPAPTRSSGKGSSALANGTAAMRSPPRTITASGSQAARTSGAMSRTRERRAEERSSERRHERTEHRERDDRRHDEVRERRDEREAPEVDEDERQGRQLRGEGHAEGLAKPRGRTTAGDGRSTARSAGPPSTRSPAVAASDSWKPMSPTIVGSSSSRTQHASAESGGGTGGATALARQEDDHAHRRGTDDARLRAGEERVAEDRDDDENAAGAPAQAGRAEQPGHDAGDERDVPAADRDDVRQPGRGEGVDDVAGHALAEADEDARGEPGLGLGQCLREARVDVPAQALDGRQQAVLVSREAHRARPHRPGRAPRSQVVREPRAVIDGRLEAAFRLDAVARDDPRVARQPRVDDALRRDRSLPDGDRPDLDERTLLGAMR